MVHCFPSCPAGELFAQAPVKEYPGVAVETVSDSSRYFVLRIQDDNGEECECYENDNELFFWSSQLQTIYYGLPV